MRFKLKKVARYTLAGITATTALLCMPAQAATIEEAVQQIYIAFYGRPADPDGVTYWAGRAANGGVSAILNDFATSLEATQLFGGMSDEGKITFIYRVMFNRDPEAAGLAYWAGELSSGKRTLQQISYEILQGALNDDLAKVNNKVAASALFANELTSRGIKSDYSSQADIFLARNWVASVQATQTSLDAATATLPTTLSRISTAGKPNTISGVLATPTAVSNTVKSAAYFLPSATKKANAAAEVRGGMVASAVTNSNGNICFGVPDGYTPLSGATVTQVDAFGTADPTSATDADSCGIFVANSIPMATAVDITATGYRPVRSGLTAFQDPDLNGQPDALTLIPTTSNYLISGLRLVNGNQLYFTVTDSATNKSVLGLSASQLAVVNNLNNLGITNFGYGAGISQTPASVALVLDASGSMSGTPLEVSAASARLFVSRKANTDELSLTIFDDSVHFLNQANTASLVANYSLTFADGTGAALTVNAPSNGYSTSTLFAEQMLKLYDNNSDAWKKTDPFFNVSQGYYPFGGWTAVYSAATAAINSLAQTNNRRYAIVMTDGYDNSSGSNTVDTTIAAAKANQVATYTVAAGTSVDSSALTRMATETGGTFTQVRDMTQVQNLSAVFDAIRTNITFDYAAVLASIPVQGTLKLSVDIGGMNVDAFITVSP